MYNKLTYLFDPLCGWCYGASPYLSSITQAPDVKVELLPTGLFSGEGARQMDDDFSAFAWSNDQRIARLTGQKFTEHYRASVLSNRQQFFDSGPATVAITAVSLTNPAKELEVLKAIQQARFVDGENITDLKILASILQSLGLEDAASMIEVPDANLLEVNRTRVSQAQALMREFDACGVPTFIADSGEKRWVIHASAVFSNR